MQQNQLVTYLKDHNVKIDALGRVVIDDPAILSEINGALGTGDAYADTLFNGGCSNGACT